MKPTINENVSLERLLDARGIPMRKRGGVLVGNCPFHEATGATLEIDPRANTWTCSTCSADTGSVVTWVMKSEGVSRKHAVELLKGDYTGTSNAKKRGPQKGVVPKAATTKKIDAPFTESDSDETTLAKVVGFYHGTLKTSPEAAEYLQSRGIGGEVIDTFKLGYANRTLSYRLPMKNRHLGAVLRERLQRLQILRASGHEHMNGSIVVPLYDDNGVVVNMYGRRVQNDKLRAGTEPHLWLDGSRKGLFNRPGIASSKTVIVTGSIFDTLTLDTHQHVNVTAIHGLDGPTDDFIDAVKQHSIERVLIAFRRSPEGDKAAEALVGRLGPLGIEVFRVVFPHGMDVNDLARSTPEPSVALTQAIRSATWMTGKPRTRTTPAPQGTTKEPEPVAAAPGGGDELDPVGASGADEIHLTFDDRRWRIRGVGSNGSPGSMRVNVFVSREGVGFHVDVFDVYSSRHRAAFLRQAGEELGIDEKDLKTDLGHVLLRLEAAQTKANRRPEPLVRNMNAADREEALAVLRDPGLLDRIVGDFERIGVVGEKTNLTIGYLAAVSRKLERPLACVIQSSSAAGKSSLMDAILSVVPAEERLSFSALTGQALYYMGDSALRHKVLSVAEEAGAEKASYALKLLQSDGALTIASTGKDATSGRLTSQEYRVEGPVALMMTTTAIDIDEELLSRCVVLTVDEGPEQTKAIQAMQRAEMTLEGRLRRTDRDRLLRLHQDVQRLLRPVLVVNPFAGSMAYADHRVRARRDHRKLLVLIEALALLHQQQRPLKQHERPGGHVVEYVEVAESDIEIATKLMSEVGSVGADDLPPQTRKVLGLLDAFVKTKGTTGEVRFTRREVREALGLGDTQMKTHLRRLVETEYVIVHPSGHGRGVVYEMAVEGTGEYEYDRHRSGYGRGSVGPRSGVGRPPENITSSGESRPDVASTADHAENARHGTNGRSAVVPTASDGGRP